MEIGIHEYLFKADGLINSIVKYFRIADPEKIYGTDMTAPQWFVLSNLMSRGPLTMGQLSKALGVGRSTMTGIVARLFKKGFVVRTHDKKDRRTVYIKHTASVQRCVKIINKRIASYVDRIFSKLILTEQKEMLVMVKRLSGIINSLDEMK